MPATKGRFDNYATGLLVSEPWYSSFSKNIDLMNDK